MSIASVEDVDMVVQGAQIFLSHTYLEWKDLAKAFLTLTSAILVFSITFSEKIIDFHNATVRARRQVFVAWILLVLAIVSCGVAICFLSMASTFAAWQIANAEAIFLRYDQPYFFYSGWAEKFLLFAGSTFALALICLIDAARRAINLRATTGR